MAGRTMKEVIEGGRLKRFIDRRIIRALSHPIREHVLAVLNERTASATEIGEEIDTDVSSFYHHVEKLQELGCIELVETKRRRGAREHFFRATTSVLFDGRGWRQLPASVRSDITASQVQSIWDEVVRALRTEVFAVGDETHLTWLPGVFDKLGWDEALALLNETLARMMDVQKRSAVRVATTGEPGIPATIAIMGFGTLPAKAAR